MVPKYADRFGDALLVGRPTRTTFEWPGFRRPLNVTRGILSTTRIQYNHEDVGLLGRELEYTIHPAPEAGFPGLEVSLQLYENYRSFWRLFAYSPAGMLFSVNLSIANARSKYMELSQSVAFRNHRMTKEERELTSVKALGTLTRLGFDVEGKRVVLGTFDAREGAFIDTTPAIFVREFLEVALVLGHYRANKGYSIKGLDSRVKRATPDRSLGSARRHIPLGLRTEVLIRDNFTCQYCGASRLRDKSLRLHVDHKIPYSQGGRTTKENLQVLCEEDNIGKGNRQVR